MGREERKNEAMKTIMEGGIPDEDIQFFATGNGADIHREVGETWTDEEGRKWIQKDGYVSSVTKMDAFRIPMFCPKCSSVMNKEKDTKMWYIHDMCLDCVIEKETEMRINGTYELYEKKKIYANMNAQLKDFEQGAEDFFNNINNQSFINDQGLEEWSELSEEQINEMKEDVNQQLNKLKEKVSALNEEITELEKSVG